jgi:(p)ppGpp synthase/HD superfamily hydrolase
VGEEPFSPSFIEALPQARAALAFARELHRGQRRESDEAPFILHPLEVAALLHTTGLRETSTKLTSARGSTLTGRAR